ncbi:MAG: histidine triad nucleotide-binding protein [Deltaproteobacteria bacterium]|nr:histidine triad nucleotide-binding protein [Deltaproteobacteria bacterium]
MKDCIFCKIVNGDIPSQSVYEDEEVVAFKDLHPQAPVHVLIIPKKHYSSLNEVEENSNTMSALFKAAQTVTKQLGIADKGYRSVINTQSDGGQTVFHLHLHILGGTLMGPSMVG